MHMAYYSDGMFVLCGCPKCKRARRSKRLPKWYRDMNDGIRSRRRVFTVQEYRAAQGKPREKANVS